MKKALICTEATYSTGFKVQQVSDAEFDVAPPKWYWVDCADDVTAERNWYDADNGTFPVMQEVIDAEALVPDISDVIEVIQ
jgi:hypothetical protein